MQVREVMTRDFEAIASNADIRAAAEKMRDLDVGMLPVAREGEFVGTVTDRDITIRAVALGSDPNGVTVSEVMSIDPVYCLEDEDVTEAAQLMEKNLVRRLLVRGREGATVGILALADLARNEKDPQLSGEVVEEVSRPAQ